MGRLITVLVVFTAAAAAQNHWYESRTGPIELLSDAPQRQSLATLGEAEQLRFGLGRLLGIQELQANPKVRLVIFKDAKEAAQYGTTPGPGFIEGRDRRNLILTVGEKLQPETIRQLVRMFVERNTGRLPPEFERGLENFMTTIQVDGAHVRWGAPPQNPDRDWARVALLATDPDYSGRAGVLLFNLQKGASDVSAYHNAFNKTKAEIEAAVDRYWAAKQFAPADAPSKPLNPQRDLDVRQLDPDVADQELADLLTSQSEAIYKRLIAKGVRLASCYEGLALLALRRNDSDAAGEYLNQAVEAGSQNAAILIRYARIEKDPEKRRTALEKAVKADPNLAEAHHAYAERLTGPAEIKELEAAARLAPQDFQYQIDLAQAYQDAQLFVQASKAWTAAENAAPTEADREKMIAKRLDIERQRLDAEEAERKRQQEEERRDVERVKAQEVARIRAAEAKANGASVDSDTLAKAVPWWEGKEAPGHVEGTLRQVDCLGSQLRLTVLTKEKKTVRLLVTDMSNVAVKGDPITFSCGVQKPRSIKLDYFPKADAKLATAGEVARIDFDAQP
jgi:tetratricopeptide (TPR) repeat protein